MSLVKKPNLTEKKLAANRRNRGQSHGPVTAEGKERIGAAQFRHGSYARAQEAALRDLGEDPAHLEELRRGLYEEFEPRGTLQEELVNRLARVLLLMDRFERAHQGHALRRAKSADSGRDNRLHAQMMRLKITADSLRLLVQTVAREHYVTTPVDLEKMKNLHRDGELKDMGEIALALFYQLQPPGTGEDGIDPNEQARRALVRLKEIFGLSSDVPPQPKVAPDSRPLHENQPGIGTSEANVAPASSQPQVSQQARWQDSDGVNRSPAIGNAGATREEKDKQYPNISAAEWDARERPRQLLENILAREVEACETQRKALLKESLAGPSPYELAAETAPSHAEALLMRRVQDANMREVRRLTNLLLKIQRREGDKRRREENNDGVVYHDMIENKAS